LRRARTLGTCWTTRPEASSTGCTPFRCCSLLSYNGVFVLGAEMSPGLRRGEIIALDLTDADFRRGQLTIARSDWCGQIGTTEGGKTRRVPMTTRLTAALQAIRHLRGPRMLYQRNAEPVSENTLRSGMRRAERAVGLPVTCHIHRLRHTFCS